MFSRSNGGEDADSSRHHCHYCRSLAASYNDAAHHDDDNNNDDHHHDNRPAARRVLRLDAKRPD